VQRHLIQVDGLWQYEPLVYLRLPPSLCAVFFVWRINLCLNLTTQLLFVSFTNLWDRGRDDACTGGEGFDSRQIRIDSCKHQMDRSKEYQPTDLEHVKRCMNCGLDEMEVKVK
jgi:hypothetical protein